MNGWPKFIQARTMPDGQLAVAIEYGDEILVGIVSLNGMNVEHKKSFNSDLRVSLITNGSEFVSITKDRYDELTYYKSIPRYADVKLIG